MKVDPELLFAGVTLVGTRKFKLPTGAIVDRARFRVIYGGHTFDLGNGRTTTSASIAYMELIRYRRYQ